MCRSGEAPELPPFRFCSFSSLNVVLLIFSNLFQHEFSSVNPSIKFLVKFSTKSQPNPPLHVVRVLTSCSPLAAPLAKPINPSHANKTATLPRPHAKSTATDSESNVVAITDLDADTDGDADATAMLTDSIGRINMGEQTNAFMQEAGKIISNMLEARLLAGNVNGNMSATPSHAGSTLSLRSNSSSNLSKSPMIVRKRLDLDDFKHIDPTQPMALQTVVALPPKQQLQQQIPLPMDSQKAQAQLPRVEHTLQAELPTAHPMSKILDICDSGKAEQAPEPVAFRNNLRRTGATHAADRRSYIEPKQSTPSTQPNKPEAEQSNSSPVFSVSVKALGQTPQGAMSEENEKAVSQLLKDGKRPICCQCQKEITS